jgi:hypothetical protein
LGAFQALSEADQVSTLHQQAQEVLKDNETTRNNLKHNEFNLWTMPNIRHATAAVLGVEGEPLKWIESRGTKEGRIEIAWELGEAALSIGLVVAGSYFTGGLGAFLLSGSALLSGHSALSQTNELIKTNAVTNTALDPTNMEMMYRRSRY